MLFDLQPALKGQYVELRPLCEEDYPGLYSVASDPLIWEQHPCDNRYLEDVFSIFFRKAIDSGGALVVIDSRTRQIIGSSRFHGYDSHKSEIEIGWTFLARIHWGGVYNGEMKQLMLRHAFGTVENVIFHIGIENWRSQRAVEKIGGIRAGLKPDDEGEDSVIFRLSSVDFQNP